MGLELYENFPEAKELFERANSYLGRRITDVMFYGSEDALMETINTQPSVFLYEVVTALTQKVIVPDVVAGHSLGEFAALVVSGCISFEDGLNLVQNRAVIGQKVCEKNKTMMGAVIGLPDDYVTRRINEIWKETGAPIYLANYNGPGQVVISGSKIGVRTALKAFMQEGAVKAVPLLIHGSFHTPYMAGAEEELGEIILNSEFRVPKCPIYQCVDGEVHSDPREIQNNLIVHITHGVQWASIVRNMVRDGITDFYEVGTDDTLQKIVRRMYPEKHITTIWEIPVYNKYNFLMNNYGYK